MTERNSAPRCNPHADLFEEWLRDHPAPCLQALVTHWGGWEKVPEVAWNDFQIRNRNWEIARLDRLYGHHTWALREELMGRPSRRGRKG